MKRGAWFRFGKQAANQSADDRTADAEKSRHDETDVLYSRHYGARDQPNYEANNNVPNDV
jgi:hypothetical protein